MPGVFQRQRDAIKTALDRRYALDSELRVAQAELLAIEERFVTVETLVESLSVRLKELLDQRETMELDLKGVRESLADLQNTVEELVGTTRSAVDFVAEESPNELRKRLFEAHRLAREGALAIEQLLQQEVLIKRDIGNVMNDSAGDFEA